MLGDDAAQRYPFMDTIVANSRLPLCREFVELTDYGASNQIGAGRHLYGNDHDICLHAQSAIKKEPCVR